MIPNGSSRGADGVGSVLDEMKREFESRVKDSEEVMETLGVTSLEELKDRTREITSSNRENAKRALARANAVASSGGNWVSPTSGDPLVMNAAPSRDPKKEARRSAAKAKEAKRKAKEAERRKNQPREPNPLDVVLVPLARAASRSPAYEGDEESASPGPSSASADSAAAVRRRPRRAAPPPPLPAPPPSARSAEPSAADRAAEEARAKVEEARAKVEEAKRVAAEAKARAEEAAAETRRKAEAAKAAAKAKAEEAKRAALEAKNAAAKDAAAAAARRKDAPPVPPRPPTLEERERETRHQRASASRELKSARAGAALRVVDATRSARRNFANGPGWNARKNSSVASATSRVDAPLNSSLWTTKRRSARLRARSGFARWSARDASFAEIASRRFAPSTPTRRDDTRTRRTKRRKETKRECDANAKRDDGRWSAKSSNSSER